MRFFCSLQNGRFFFQLLVKVFSFWDSFLFCLSFVNLDKWFWLFAFLHRLHSIHSHNDCLKPINELECVYDLKIDNLILSKCCSSIFPIRFWQIVQPTGVLLTQRIPQIGNKLFVLYLFSYQHTKHTYTQTLKHNLSRFFYGLLDIVML